MAGHDQLIADDLQHTIYYFLDNDLLSNALLLASRLLVYEPSADASHLLSLCYLGSGQLSAAAEYSKDFGKSGQHLGCTYVFAKCCLGLGQYKDCILALEQSKHAWSRLNNWGNYSYNLLFNLIEKSET
jgi:anaphase-promoting complex subunit 3